MEAVVRAVFQAGVSDMSVPERLDLAGLRGEGSGETAPPSGAPLSPGSSAETSTTDSGVSNVSSLASDRPGLPDTIHCLSSTIAMATNQTPQLCAMGPIEFRGGEECVLGEGEGVEGGGGGLGEVGGVSGEEGSVEDSASDGLPFDLSSLDLDSSVLSNGECHPSRSSLGVCACV